MRLVVVALMILTVLGCASVSPSDPRYPDYVVCGGARSPFGISEKVRTCMENKKAAREARAEETKRKAQAERERAERRKKEYVQQQAELEKAEEARRASCGEEFKTLRVGISLEDAKRCWPRFRLYRLTGEVTRPEGVVSVYEIPFDSANNLAYAVGVSAIYFMNGRIVGWTR